MIEVFNQAAALFAKRETAIAKLRAMTSDADNIVKTAENYGLMSLRLHTDDYISIATNAVTRGNDPAVAMRLAYERSHGRLG